MISRHKIAFAIFLVIAFVACLSAMFIGGREYERQAIEPQIVELNQQVKASNDEVLRWNIQAQISQQDARRFLNDLISTREKYQELIIHPLIQEVSVEKIVYQESSHKEWESIEQFVEWYHQLRIMLFSNDCNAIASFIIDTAEQYGYSVSYALALNGYYYGVRVTSASSGIPSGHAGCLIRTMDGTYYWFEPNPEKFEVIKVIGK